MAGNKPTKLSKRAQADIKSSARQATKSAKSQSKRIKASGQELLRQARANARNAQKNARNDAREFAAMGRALKKLGLYNTRKPLNIKSITPARAQKIKTKFSEFQNHGIPKHGKVIRPLYRTPKGYELNSRFKFKKTKVRIKTKPGIIQTRKGIVVEVPHASDKIRRIEKDGTVIMRETRGGIDRNVYTGTLTNKQAIAFLDSIDNGTFEFPLNYYIAVSAWRGRNEHIAHNLEQLRKILSGYWAGLYKVYSQKESPEGIEPLHLEYVERTPNEIAQEKAIRAKAKKKRGKRK